MKRRASRVCAAAALALLASAVAREPTVAAPAPSLHSAAVAPAVAAPTLPPAAPPATTPISHLAAVVPTALASSGPAPTAPVSSGPAPGASGDDIRDIRGPKAVFPLSLVLELLAAAAVLAAGGYAWWRWRRRRQARALKYFEIALRRLEALRGLMQPARVREFSSAISDIVRQYIEAGFQVTATHRTTEEFLHDILATENSPLSAHRALLSEFLRQCDLAKFAGMSLSEATMESLYQSARGFVIGTSPAA